MAEHRSDDPTPDGPVAWQHDAGDDGGPAGLARLLGLFSLGLGVVQVLAPRSIARTIGVDPTPGTRALIRGIGVQELVLGRGIMGRARPAGWLWSRVAGDAAHLALLGTAMQSSDGEADRTRAAAGAVAGVAALDLLASIRNTGRGTDVVQTVAATTVNRPPDAVYRFWRDLENLPRFSYHLLSVRPTTGGRSHWVALGPAGMTVSWDAEIVEDVPAERLSWRSLPGGDVDTSGCVEFRRAPGGRGTEVTVELRTSVPGGRAGRAAAMIAGEHPAQQAEDDLRRFKQILETGEVVRSDGSPEGSRSQRQWKQEPAVPSLGEARR